MPVVEIKVVPMGTVVPSISSYVRDCYQLARQDATVRAEITPTATVVEGELDHVLALAREMHRLPFARGVDRVLTTITIDERTDADQGMGEMVAAVTEEDFT